MATKVMSDWISRTVNNIPSRRPCIRGPHCRGTCCSSMVNYDLIKKNKHREVHTAAEEHASSNSSTGCDAGGSGDGSHWLSDSLEDKDEVDCSVIRQFNLSKSSSFSTSPIRGKSLTQDSSPESAKLSHSLPKISPSISVHGIPHKFKTGSVGTTRQSKEDHAPSYLKNGKNPNVLVYLIIGATGILLALIFTLPLRNLPGTRFTQEDFKKELNAIGAEYNIKFDPMLRIRKGIETTFNKEDTSSIVFLYQFMDQAIVKEFANKVANVSANYLRNDTGTAGPIIVEKSDLNVATVGELVAKYRNDLESQGVVLFQDLEDVPVDLAMAFHYYCDEYDPLVKKTAVFFTLNMAKCREYVGKTQHEVVERCLTEKWRTLEQEKLLPLLTRVVSVVIDLEEAQKR